MAIALGLLLMPACKRDAATTPPRPQAEQRDDSSRQADAEALRHDYPDRDTPFDAYEAQAKMVLRVAMRNPHQLNAELKNLTDIFSTSGPLALESTLRESLHSAGVPSPVLDQLDPKGEYGLSFSYPLRSYEGETWARLPAKDLSALTREVVTWLTLDEVGPKLWRSQPGDVNEGAQLDAAHTNEGVYVHATQGGLSVALRQAQLQSATAPKSADGVEHDLLIEVSGVASASRDLLADLDKTLHNGDRADWEAWIEAVDRAWISVDAKPNREMEFGLGVEGRVGGWDGGLLGPARRSPAPVAQDMPAGAVLATTMSWGNPEPALSLIDNFRPGSGSSALERDFLEIAALAVDHVVQDVGLAIYVDREGEHTLLFAASVDNPGQVGELSDKFIALLDRSQRASEAGITAREVSGELTPQAAKAARHRFKQSTLKVNKQKAKQFSLELDDEDGKLAVMLDAKGFVHISSFVQGDTLFVLMGPDLKGFVRSRFAPKAAKLSGSEGYLAAHSRLGGCQVCGMSDGGLMARSMYGRAARGLPADKRAEARSLLPKLEDGGQSMFMLRNTPARIDLMFATDRAKVAADPQKAAAWESFMRALGHRGEAVTDPRQWLFGMAGDR